MLIEARGITRFVIVCGTTDLRKGIDGLALIVHKTYGLNPFERDVLFLFCGRRSDRIKALLWEGNGFLLLYKRFEGGSLSWPRNQSEAATITRSQYRDLLHGLNPITPKIPDVTPTSLF
jgi:transposase